MSTDPTLPALAAPRTGHSARLVLQIVTASLITLPAVLHAASGRGSYLGAALVFAVALSTVWIVCAIGLSMRPTAAPRTQPSATLEPTTPAGGTDSSAGGTGPTTGRQPLARIPVVRVPADQAVHADIDGHVTSASAATSTTGAVR